MDDVAFGVFWQGKPVGRIAKPDLDNFHLRGEWIAEHSEAAEQSLSVVAAYEYQELWVTCGTGEPPLCGTVEFFGCEPPSSSTQIEITIRS